MNSTASLSQKTRSVQLKGSLLPLTVLELLHFDPKHLSSDLSEKTSQAPDFFKDLPVVISLAKFDESKGVLNFEELISICKVYSVKPIAVSGASEAQQIAAKFAGLANMASQREKPTQVNATEEVELINETAEKPGQTGPLNSTEASTSEASPATRPQISKVIYQPVRSGQQIYAQDGDLIVLAQVSAGAEILADGNIHVYGPLRGRALAGVKGNTDARIFCQSLEAELVSIAGQYKISEDLQNGSWKKPAQIHLSDEKLTVKPLVD